MCVQFIYAIFRCNTPCIFKCNAFCNKRWPVSAWSFVSLTLCIRRKKKQKREREKERNGVDSNWHYLCQTKFFDRNTYLGCMPESTSSIHSLTHSLKAHHTILYFRFDSLLLRSLIHQIFWKTCNSIKGAFSIVLNLLKGQKSLLEKVEEYLNGINAKNRRKTMFNVHFRTHYANLIAGYNKQRGKRVRCQFYRQCMEVKSIIATASTTASSIGIKTMNFTYIRVHKECVCELLYFVCIVSTHTEHNKSELAARKTEREKKDETATSNTKRTSGKR